jgi:hypothetical protein
MSKTLHPDLSVFLYDWCGFRSFCVRVVPIVSAAMNEPEIYTLGFAWVIPHPLRGEKDGGNAGCDSGAPF